MACCRRHSSRAVTIPMCASAAFPCIRYLAPVGVGDCCSYPRNVGCCQRACFRRTPRFCSLQTRVTAAICTLPLRTGSSTLVPSWGHLLRNCLRIQQKWSPYSGSSSVLASSAVASFSTVIPSKSSPCSGSSSVLASFLTVISSA